MSIGPERDTPSWAWVGRDLASELSRRVRVRTFSDFSSAPRAKCTLIVKQPCTRRQLESISSHGKVVYCPIDYISDTKHMDSMAWLLRGCHAIASHCERLSEHLARFSSRVRFVEHHDKFSVPCSGYKRDGYVLWVGGFQYAPYLLDYLKNNRVDARIRLLSDIGNRTAVNAAKRNARSIGLDLRLTERTANGLEVVPWSEAEQSRMLSECKAAIDVKREGDFNQDTKPPTKAQKYVCSGIPVSVNTGSYSHEYFRRRGLVLPTPTDGRRWLSEEFHAEVAEFSKGLRARLSIESVADTYMDIFREVTSSEP